MGRRFVLLFLAFTVLYVAALFADVGSNIRNEAVEVTGSDVRFTLK